MDMITEKIGADLNVSQVKDNHFCFTRMDTCVILEENKIINLKILIYSVKERPRQKKNPKNLQASIYNSNPQDDIYDKKSDIIRSTYKFNKGKTAREMKEILVQNASQTHIPFKPLEVGDCVTEDTLTEKSQSELRACARSLK